MKILILPSWYPTKEHPLNGIFFKEQARALKEFGHDVVVAYPELISLKDLGKLPLTQRVTESEEDGIRTFRMQRMAWVPRRVPYVEGDLFNRTVHALYQKIKETGWVPDVIHAHSTLWAGWAALKLSDQTGIPFVVTEHASKFLRNLVRPYEKTYVRQILAKAKASVAVGPGLQSALKAYGSGLEVRVIPNIVDTERFSTLDSTAKNERKTFRFFSVGFLNHNKGMDTLIQAFSEAFKNQTGVELVIGGDGDQRPVLEKMVRDLGIEEQVHFLGMLSRDQVVQEMQKAHAFALASRKETFGVVLIEALSSGIPIIATASGGPDLIVTAENGLLVQPENPTQFAEAMTVLYTQYDRYNEDQIRQDCIQRFSKAAIVKQITELYKESTAK